MSFFFSVFFPFWRKKLLVGQERKHLGPIIYFPSSPPNQTHSKKIFLPIFSSKFSIHPISPRNKHIHKALKPTPLRSQEVLEEKMLAASRSGSATGGTPAQGPQVIRQTHLVRRKSLSYIMVIGRRKFHSLSRK